MTHELMLAWLSERGDGSMSQFRQSHSWLYGGSGVRRFSPEITAHSLSILGHIEVNWRAGRWCAAPPVLTILPNAGAYALLTGGRTRTLMRHLEKETSEETTMYVHLHSQTDAPDAIFLAIDDEKDVEQLAFRLGIAYEFSVSERLSRFLPQLETVFAVAKTTPPALGFGIERFNAQSLKWHSCQASSEAGFYRIDFPGHYEYRFRNGQGTYYAPDRATGIYMELARCGRSLLSYQREPRNGTLIVPIRAPIPIIQARCAVLCSGLSPTPSEHEGVRRFVNVPERIAQRIASSLQQHLKMDGPVSLKGKRNPMKRKSRAVKRGSAVKRESAVKRRRRHR